MEWVIVESSNNVQIFLNMLGAYQNIIRDYDILPCPFDIQITLSITNHEILLCTTKHQVAIATSK
jgi:hypothetical protein